MMDETTTKNSFPAITACFLALIVLLNTGCGENDTVEDVDKEDSQSARICITESTDLDNTAVDTSGDFELHALYLCPKPEWQFLSSSCQVDQVEEGKLTVSSQFQWQHEPNQSNRGRPVCGQAPVASCDMPNLEAGDYELVHGEQEYQLTVPSGDNLDCERRLNQIQAAK